MNNCPLCLIPQDIAQQYRVVKINDLVYSVIPKEPLVEGHVLVLPRRHVCMRDLTAEESLALNMEIDALKEKLVDLYPTTPPFIAAMSDTKHASIPEHLHYHLVPFAVGLRTLIHGYDSHIPERRVAEHSEIERMASLLRE